MSSFKYSIAIILFMTYPVIGYAESNTSEALLENSTESMAIAEKTLLTDPTKPVEIRQKNDDARKKIPIKSKFFDVQIISYRSGGGSFVVINGKRFVEGDAFDETTIKTIEKNKVILSNPERKPLVLEYANLSIKKDGENTP